MDFRPKRKMKTSKELAEDVLNQWDGNIENAIKDIEGTIKSFNYTKPILGAEIYYEETLKELKAKLDNQE